MGTWDDEMDHILAKLERISPVKTKCSTASNSDSNSDSTGSNLSSHSCDCDFGKWMKSNYGKATEADIEAIKWTIPKCPKCGWEGRELSFRSKASLGAWMIRSMKAFPEKWKQQKRDQWKETSL